MLKESIEKGAEQLIIQLVAFNHVTDYFCRLPVFSSSRRQSPFLFRKGTPALSKVSMFLNEIQGLEEALGSIEQLL